MSLKKTLTLALVALMSLAGASTLASAADTYEIDLGHSGINFRVMHLGVAYTWGRFNDFSGTIMIDEENPAKSSVELTIKMDSVDTNQGDRDKHLRSPDFFDAKTFPVATFKSSSVSKKDDVYTVEGTLDLHGQKKPVTLELTRVGSGKHPRSGADITGFAGTYTLKRSDFGMTYGIGGIGDEVELFIDIEAAKK